MLNFFVWGWPGTRIRLQSKAAPPLGHIDTGPGLVAHREPPRCPLQHFTKVCRRLLALLVFAQCSHIAIVATFFPQAGTHTTSSPLSLVIAHSWHPVPFQPRHSLSKRPPITFVCTSAPLHKTSTFTSAGAYTPWNSQRQANSRFTEGRSR